MQTIRLLIIALCLQLGFFATAQDATFSQFYYNPVYFNPSLAGINDNLELRSTIRQHWPGLNGGFNNSTLSLDYFEPFVAGGLGAQFVSNYEAGGFVKKMAGNFAYAYRLPLIRNKMYMQMGLQAGAVFKQVNCENLVFSNQLDPIYGDVYESGFCNTPMESVIYPDFATGATLVFNTRKNRLGLASTTNTIGVAIHHLTTPNESMIGLETNLPLKFVVHAQSVIPIQKGLRDAMMLAPAIIYERQSMFEHLTFGMNAVIEPVFFGLWIRNENYMMAKENYSSFVILAGLTVVDRGNHKLQISYSYDINTARLQAATAGSHELSVRYQVADFSLGNKRKPSLRQRAKSNKYCYNKF